MLHPFIREPSSVPFVGVPRRARAVEQRSTLHTKQEGPAGAGPSFLSGSDQAHAGEGALADLQQAFKARQQHLLAVFHHVTIHLDRALLELAVGFGVTRGQPGRRQQRGDTQALGRDHHVLQRQLSDVALPGAA
ncbi:hypothetical protein G6F65_021187 [Rhizopus arrhizus]|nr:hypothetical protein G6F65_021187 [Rhizopus arrhizus]